MCPIKTWLFHTPGRFCFFLRRSAFCCDSLRPFALVGVLAFALLGAHLPSFVLFWVLLRPTAFRATGGCAKWGNGGKGFIGFFCARERLFSARKAFFSANERLFLQGKGFLVQGKGFLCKLEGLSMQCAASLCN